MPTTLDFNFRRVLREFHGGARLHVLLAMMLHANVRNRCWPSMRGLAKETGYALAAVNDAKKWLEEHGAIEIVKYEHRVNEEREQKANHLQNVYQLTGVIKFDGVTYPVLYVPQIETSENETSICGTEVVTSLKPLKQTNKTDVVVVSADTESGEFAVKAEPLQPITAHREGTDDFRAVEEGLKNAENNTLNHPVPQHPLSPVEVALVASLMAGTVSEALAESLVVEYGAVRVADVWKHAKDHSDTIHTPIGFLRSELAKPFYVPLRTAGTAPVAAVSVPVVAAWPDEEGATESDEGDSAEEVFIASDSIHTLLSDKDKDTAAARWTTCADQLRLKWAIKDTQLAAYDASTQTYTVQVRTAHVAQSLNGRHARGILSTLQGLHAGATVVFVHANTAGKGQS